MSAPPMEWSALLVEAVSKPGVIAEAYQRFWNYSVGNQVLALVQCFLRGISPGPIHTFVGWQHLGRQVKKGEKAIVLCRPVTCKARPRMKETTVEPTDQRTYTRFVYRPHWFVLAQTEGAEYQPAELPTWQEARALEALEIARVEFENLSGNTQGYAVRRQVAVSPIAFAPHRTLFHELAHVVLGHTAEVEWMDDDETTPVNLREVEAESVALICTESLGLGTAVFSRGYIQHWLKGEKIPERSAQRIFKTADLILKAGRPETAAGEREDER